MQSFSEFINDFEQYRVDRPLIEAPEYYDKMGLITPEGRLVFGMPSETMHDQIAKRSGIMNLVSALHKGAVRWAVLAKTHNLMFSWYATKTSTKLMDKTKDKIREIIKDEPGFVGDMVEFDIGGKGFFNMPVPKALQFVKSA